MSNYLNKNGLVNGLIPKGNACPFLEKCNVRNERCPSQTNHPSGDYSCAMARLHSMIVETDDSTLKNVRDNMGLKPQHFSRES